MIRCIAIDDEPMALTIIQKYCEEYGDIELECFDSPLEGVDRIISDPPDIVLLDIEMNPLNGLELARRLPKDVCLIFTTAFRQYAIDGFELNAVDYIQKPILYPRFEKAMNKGKRWLRIEENYITLNVEHQKVKINIEDITYIEAMDNYVRIHRGDLAKIMTLMTMRDLMEMLPKEMFVRIHRSYIVAVGKVERVGKKGVVIGGVPEALPIGRTYWSDCRNLIC